MTKRPVGRPTDHDPNFCAKVDEYLKKNQDEHYEFHKTRGEKSDSFEERLRVRLPTREGFAKFIGVSRDSLNEWEGIYKDFSDALKKIDAEQKMRLMNEGLAGNYNPVIAKLLLSANHGMAEKSEEKQEHTSGVTVKMVRFTPDGDHSSV